MIVVRMNRVGNHREVAVKCGAPWLGVLFWLHAAAWFSSWARRSDPRHRFWRLMRGELVVNYLVFQASHINRIPRRDIVVRNLQEQEDSSHMHDDGTDQRFAARRGATRTRPSKQVGRIP